MTARNRLAPPEGATVPRTWVLVLTSAASLMVALDLLVVSTALTTIRLDLDAPVEQLQWTVTAYGLAFAVLLMPGAALGDRFGRRRMFTVGRDAFGQGGGGREGILRRGILRREQGQS
ncbi:MAG: MFS transporter, partial [Pseudonocardia sp.]|nr:MFS transporter [Pseudonocardia sp.]